MPTSRPWVLTGLLLAGGCGETSEPSPVPEPPPGFAGVRIQQRNLSFLYPGEVRRIDAIALDTAGRVIQGVRVDLQIRDTSVFRLGRDGQLRSRMTGNSWIVAEAFDASDSVFVQFQPDRPVWRIPVLVDVVDIRNPVYAPSDSVPAQVERQFDQVNSVFRPATTDGYLYFEVARVRMLEEVSPPPRRGDEPYSFRVVYDPNGLLKTAWYPELTAWMGGLFLDGPWGLWATRTLVHELGHGRGAVDLYAQEVNLPVNNPITGAVYDAPPAIMSDLTRGWDPHSRFLINRNAGVLDAPLGGYLGEFPAGMVVHVRDESGGPVPDAAVAVYPVQWYSTRVAPGPVAIAVTDGAGDASLPGNVFSPDWANLHVVATAGGKVYLGWIPYVDAQYQFFTAPPGPYEITLAAQAGAGVARQLPLPPWLLREAPPRGSRLPLHTYSFHGSLPW